VRSDDRIRPTNIVNSTLALLVRRAVLRRPYAGALESFGLRCAYAGDIATGQDTLVLDAYAHADAIITNRPTCSRSCRP
jgi:hypothetical protein